MLVPEPDNIPSPIAAAMDAKGFRRTLGVSTLFFAFAVVAAGAASAGNGWGNDHEPDWNDAQCDDDEGTGNDAKCMDGSDEGSAGGGSGGHGWGNDREPDWNDAQCDDDEGTGNDWKCTGEGK